MMAKIRGRDTQPEIFVRRLLHRQGYRFRLYAKDLPGRPDIVFRSRRKVIFVHGCFWHRHEGCKKASMPKTRIAYWRRKFEANRKRDSESVLALEEMGWKVMVIWGCEISSIGKNDLLERVTAFLDGK
ncbi:MAG: very short patch repair endonuclease [Gammaproteobacteria bacterium]|nr:very short patch repair endonuclease [Gammaproteobacteria bacterium]